VHAALLEEQASLGVVTLLDGIVHTIFSAVSIKQNISV